MREIRVEKVTLNVGVGEPGEKLERVMNLLKTITGEKPIKTMAKKRIPEWNLRPRLEIGTMVTLRGKKAEDMLVKLFKAVEDKIPAEKFDDNGNLSFGIPEYVYIPGVKYDYTVGIIGLSVAVTLSRPGFNIAKKRFKRKIGKKHRITKEEAIEFIKKKFNLNIV